MYFFPWWKACSIAGILGKRYSSIPVAWRMGNIAVKMTNFDLAELSQPKLKLKVMILSASVMNYITSADKIRC